MFTKSILTAAALAVALPFAANANDGQAMQAATLNVDASAFTTNELAQIAAERGDTRKAERAARIQAQKTEVPGVTNAGRDMQAAILNLDPANFTTNELAQIDAETSALAKAERIEKILDEKSGATVSTSGVKSLTVEYVHHGRDDA
ncbi:hypothetical protein [Paracoccus zhejiangensis]|uniref:DUF4148 domain-containing protein n=1 Tax=Paracoccus zhejiangensis TaxID=1077935 RepID=A0A2H5F1M4_9RHOB|nr:hypothetical protein [Paracoccus zhejiangensis]AUH65427.1 hypothetical protein CX676_15685 [Paracoccus zhejiangensis]